MDKKPEPMTEDRLNAFLDSELRNTIGYGETGDEISDERRRNLEYYLNKPLGDEQEGRSKLQSSDVQDVTEALMPDMLAPFISADKVVEFKPGGEEDEEFAEVASEYCNYIFQVDNDGLKIQYTWVKDAILQKNGFVYADWTHKERTKRHQVKVYYPDLAKLADDAEIEILEIAAFDQNGNAIDPKIVEAAGFDPEQIALSAPFAASPEEICFEVDFRRTWKEGRVKVCNVPPEYVIVSNTATSEEDARIIGWMEQTTLSELRQEGYSEDVLDGIPLDDSEYNDVNGERTVRESAQGGFNMDGRSNGDPSTVKIWRTVVWTRVDFDGDGKAELRKIIRAGSKRSGGKVIYNEEADRVPVVSFTSIPMSHQLFGRCPADQTISIQDGKTAMLRATMNGTYMTIEPRYAYVEDLASEDTWDDLMLGVPGAPIRMARADAIQQIGDAPDLSSAYQMMEYFDRIRESRTPVSRQDQGIDPDVLRDKTAREATIQANASARRKELMLRLYAESLGKLFKLILELAVKHQDRPRQVRLMNKFMTVDPRYWNTDMDVTVSVGLGTGTKEQQLQSLMMIHEIQMADMQMGTGLTDPAKLYNTRAKLVEYQGLSSPELYFNDPESEEQPQQPPQPSPEEIEAQKQAEAEQVQQAIDQAHEAGKQEGIDQVKLAELQAKERMHAKDVQLNAAQINQKAEEMAIKAQLEVAKIQQQAEANRQSKIESSQNAG
jgi:hypothetical protein